MPEPWEELVRIGERIIAAQAAERTAWGLYAADPTEALLERWRFARDEVSRLLEERDQLVRDGDMASS